MAIEALDIWRTFRFSLANAEEKSKTEIFEFLNESELYAFDERAGIAEFDGQLSRREAEDMAWHEILKKRIN